MCKNRCGNSALCRSLKMAFTARAENANQSDLEMLRDIAELMVDDCCQEHTEEAMAHFASKNPALFMLFSGRFSNCENSSEALRDVLSVIEIGSSEIYRPAVN